MRRMHAAMRAPRMKISTRKQRELLGKVVQESDVVITTAVIPGKKSSCPRHRRNGEGNGAGLRVVDLAAERGGQL